MNEQDISYALAKQVPDMHFRGFIIGTSYGEISVPPGALAEQLADTVRLVLALELARIRQDGDEATEYLDAKRQNPTPASGANLWASHELAGK